MKNIQGLQNVSNEIRVALLTLLTDVSERGLEPTDHDGFKDATLAKVPCDWSLDLSCKDGQGVVEIRAREPNALLDESDGRLEVAVYRENTELMCFAYELQRDGMAMWTFRTEEKDPRVQGLLKNACPLRGDARDLYDPRSEAFHGFIWSVIGPLVGNVS